MQDIFDTTTVAGVGAVTVSGEVFRGMEKMGSLVVLLLAEQRAGWA